MDFRLKRDVARVGVALAALAGCKSRELKVHEEIERLCDPPKEVLNSSERLALGFWATSFAKEEETQRLLSRIGREDVTRGQIADDLERTGRAHGVQRCPLAERFRPK